MKKRPRQTSVYFRIGPVVHHARSHLLPFCHFHNFTNKEFLLFHVQRYSFFFIFHTIITDLFGNNQ